MSTLSKRLVQGIAAAATLALLPPFLLVGCSSGGGGGSSTTTGFAVEASPAAQAFTSPGVQVTLTAVGKTHPNPAIHYTLDLSEPTAVSPVYTTPFTVTDTTVVKAIAINPDNTESSVLVKGYVLADTPFYQEWAASGHGDIAGEPFRHWDAEGEVATSCARCHGGGGLKDWAEDGVVDNAGTILLGHQCDTCHIPPPLTIWDDQGTYANLAEIEFPSGDLATLHGPSNLCLACHQGRESGLSLQEDFDDDPIGPYTFVNIHYYAAGATFFGTETHAGWEYPRQTYVGRNSFPSHEAEQQNCVGCHMRGDLKDHTLLPAVGDCTGCHTGTSFETLSGTPSSNHDAIATTEAQLLAAIQAYADQVLGFPIAYDAHTYPYFVHDTNGNGDADADELGFANRYNQFDQKLLKAAYNFQVAAKDPAGYIHNGVYIRQLIHDSLNDLGVMPAVPAPDRAGFNFAAATKSEQWHMSGHGDTTAEPFNHWNEDGEVSASCARCHSSTGFVDYIEDGTTDNAAPLGETVGCQACHNSTNLFADASTRFDDLISHPELDPVTFPSGDTGTMGDASNLCITCHQGRASSVTVAAATPNSTVQTPTDYDSYSFINRHYLAAGAILFGADAQGGYEYAGQTYAGKNTFAGHAGTKDTCLKCHMRGTEDHSFSAQLADCNQCHFGITDFDELGLPNGVVNVDYDGDGLGESFQLEIDGMLATLLTNLQAYAHNDLPQSSPIVYGAGSYPYWFKDTNDNGVLDPSEATSANGYKDFDEVMLQAAYNYHSGKDPCSHVHNYKYVLQTLYDSADMLDDGLLNGSITGTRP